MNSLSFDIKSSSDFFQKLLGDYREFCIDKTSSRRAINCAMTSWHLTDWTYHEFKQQLFPQFDRPELYQNHIKVLCPSLQIMHDITTGTKHYFLNRHNPKIKETNLHVGDFNNGFNRDLNISTLEIEMKDGTKIYFEDALENAISFWKQYLRSTFQIIIELN